MPSSGLAPGSYDVHVSAPSFLPTLREDVVLAAGASKILNITLNTLFEAVSMLPPLKKSNDEDDSWKWTLRSTANRPVLRFDDDTAMIVETQKEGQAAEGHAGSYGRRRQRGLRQRFRSGHGFQRRAVASSTPAPWASPATSATATAHPTACFAPRMSVMAATAGIQSVALIVRRFSAPDTVPHGGALEAIAMSYADGFSIGDVLDFQFGGEARGHSIPGTGSQRLPSVGDRRSAISASNTILEYRYATTEPNTRASKGFDSAPADLTETGPRMTMVDGEPLLENAHHHELSISQRIGDNKLQLAYYNDRVKDPALLGVGVINTLHRRRSARRLFRHLQLQRRRTARRKACASSSSTACRTISPPPSITPTVACSNWSSPAFPGVLFADNLDKRLAAFGCPQAERLRAALADQVDCFLSLDQRPDPGSG